MEKNFFTKLKEENEGILDVFFAVIGIAVGIIMILMSTTYEIEVLSAIGQLFISIFAGSLLLEWFGFVKYTQKRMCEVLAENKVLDVLSTQRKKELKTAILNNLYMPNKDLGENNIVSVLDNEMDNILKDYYYNEYIMYIDIAVEKIENRKYIKKVIRKTFTAETINNEKCKIKQLISTQINPVLKKKTVTFNSLKINDEKWENIPMLEKDNSGNDSNHYEKLMYPDLSGIEEKLVFKDKVEVDMTYTTYTDIGDMVYSHQINRPCKHYCVHFNYPQYICLDVVGFGFMVNGNAEKKRLVKTLNGHMLRFLSWILPGDGVMAAIKIKQ